MAKTFDISTHNMFFQLNPDKWREDLTKSGKGEITGYQEAGDGSVRTTLKNWCQAQGRGLYHPKESGNPISWSSQMFAAMPFRGMVKVHPAAHAFGLNAPYNPARDFVYQGLAAKDTQSQGLVINVHTLAGGTKDEQNPDNTDSEALTRYKDWGIAQYWLDVLSFVAAQMSLQVPGKKTMEAKWDWICVLGDFNAETSNKEQWYYPGNLLLAVCDQDKMTGGLDHIVFSKGSDLDRGKRWTEQGHTDHRIHFQAVTITSEQTDFPRDK